VATIVNKRNGLAHGCGSFEGMVRLCCIDFLLRRIDDRESLLLYGDSRLWLRKESKLSAVEELVNSILIQTKLLFVMASDLACFVCISLSFICTVFYLVLNLLMSSPDSVATEV
jgi:hypothetical protein